MKYCTLKKSVAIGEYITGLYGSGKTLMSIKLSKPDLAATIRTELDAQFNRHRDIPQIVESSSIMIGTLSYMERILVNGELNMTSETYLQLFEPIMDELIIHHDDVTYRDGWEDYLMDKRDVIHMKYGFKPRVLELHIDFVDNIRKSEAFKDLIHMTTVGYPTVETTKEVLEQVLDIKYINVIVPQ